MGKGTSLFILKVLFSGFCFFLLGDTVYAQRPPVPTINMSYFRVDFLQPGARPAGLGGAFIGAAQDETAAPVNPAGLTYLNSVGASLHQRPARREYKEPQGSPQNPNRRKKFHANNFDQAAVSVFLPLEIFKPLQDSFLDNITLALFRQVVFDSRFTFETQQFLTTTDPLSARQVLGGLGNFPGRRVNLDLEMVSDGLSIAFPLTRRISIGLTAKTSVLNFKLNERTFLDPEATEGSVQSGNIAETTYSITTVDERNTELAYSAGLMAQLIRDRLFVGAVYHFNPTFTLKSDIFLPEYTVGDQTFPAESQSNIKFDLTVPDVYGFGIYYIASPRIRFTADVVRVEYTDFLSGNDLNWPADDVFSSRTQSFQDTGASPDLTIDDATELHFGVEIVSNVPKLGLIPLRFGLSTIPGHRIYSADPNPDMRRLFPKSDDLVNFSFGLGFVLTRNIKFDGSIVLSDDGFEVFGSILLTVPL